jgi:hypothetical protein
MKKIAHSLGSPKKALLCFVVQPLALAVGRQNMKEPLGLPLSYSFE